jgi:hypothetical protein
VDSNQRPSNRDRKGLKKRFYILFVPFGNGKTGVYVLSFQPQSLKKGKVPFKTTYLLLRESYLDIGKEEIALSTRFSVISNPFGSPRKKRD